MSLRSGRKYHASLERSLPVEITASFEAFGLPPFKLQLTVAYEVTVN